VTERGLPLADGASACPFVAFEDDRDERASVPDHRHRCYAETRPAPRAIAHQEAYCLSSAFPVCPTFQDWARREAARARAGAAGSMAAAAGSDRSPDAQTGSAAGFVNAAAGAGAGDAALTGAERDDDGAPDDDGTADDDRAADDRAGRSGPALPDGERDTIRRNPPRDWAAPPPWLASAEGAVRPGEDAEPPPFLGRRSSEPGQGLAGSAADRLAGGEAPSRRAVEEDRRPTPPIDEDEVGVAAMAAAATPRTTRPTAPLGVDDGEADDLEDGGQVRRVTRRPRAYDQHLGGPDGPDWERPRRFEAYPTIRSRVQVPHIPRLVAMAVVIGLLALALFLLPGFLNLGGGTGSPGATASPGRSGGVAASVAPTQPPAPTPSVYTIKKGETLSKIATRNGLTIEELLAANPDIKNPNKVGEGQQIIIPSPSGAPPSQAGGSPKASAATGSAAP